MHSTRTALFLVLFAAAGLAANVSCTGNASGNWYITNQNVTCQNAEALNMSGATVYIQGYSNVSFLNITNSSIAVNVYNTANFTLNNGTLAVVNAYNNSVVTLYNNSLLVLSSSAYFEDNSSVNITNTTVSIANYYLTVKFEGNTTTISDSYIGKATGSYYAWRILFDKGTANISN